MYKINDSVANGRLDVAIIVANADIELFDCWHYPQNNRRQQEPHFNQYGFNQQRSALIDKIITFLTKLLRALGRKLSVNC